MEDETSNKSKKQTKINVKGNVDNGAVIVGDGNQVNISDNFVGDKIASELAIRRLKEDIDELQYTRNDIKGTSYVPALFSNNCLGLIIMIVLGFILALFLGRYVFREMESPTWVIVGFVVMIFFLAGVVDVRSEKEAAQERDILDKQIDKKYEELEKYEKIVNSK